MYLELALVYEEIRPFWESTFYIGELLWLSGKMMK
jgi:hypothetical protein